MGNFQVTCVTKSQPEGRPEQITHIGNAQENWRVTRERAIAGIESGTEMYFVVDHVTGRRAYLGVVREVSKPPYLCTCVDGQLSDDLLVQPDCADYCAATVRRAKGGLSALVEFRFAPKVKTQHAAPKASEQRAATEDKVVRPDDW